MHISKSQRMMLVVVANAFLCWNASSAARAAEPPKSGNPAPPAAAAAKPTFENVGPQVGEQLPDLRLKTTKGEPFALSNAWYGGPTLIVTSSFTCPKSRSRWPELAAIAKKYGEKLNVVVVYVIEAHPVGSACPYKGVEDVTPENERDGILRKQPSTLEDRQELAQEFKRYLRVDAPIYVDPLDNRAWKAFGAAPNIAFLVGQNGIVAARQGWFDGPALEKSIDAYLEKTKAAEDEAAAQSERELNNLREGDALDKAGLRRWNVAGLAGDPNTDKLSALLKKYPSAIHYVFRAEQGYPHDTTWLIESVTAKNLAAAEVLLKNGADIKAGTRSYSSALEVAAQVGQIDMVKLLLRYKADPNDPATGNSPLHEALIAGNLDIAKTLIEAGANEDLFSAIALDNAAQVRAALAADPSRASRPDGANRLPLDYAAANGRLEIAKLLLEKGAPVVDYELSPIKVPLHYAIERNDAAMLELLLKAGSSPSTAFGWRGESPNVQPPLHMAINKDELPIAKLLLANKPDLKARDTYSQTALHHAAGLGKENFVELLIQAGADVKATTKGFSLPCGSGEEEKPQYNTPLHFAAARGNPATIKALVAGGADIDAPNANGLTPLMSALEPPLYTGINEKTQLQNIEQLVASGANVNVRDKEGRTVLDMVTSSTQTKQPADEAKAAQAIADVLKKHGAKPGEPKKKTAANVPGPAADERSNEPDPLSK